MRAAWDALRSAGSSQDPTSREKRAFPAEKQDPGDPLVSHLSANDPKSAHMANVIGRVHLDLESIWIKELEGFLRLGVRKLEVHFR